MWQKNHHGPCGDFCFSITDTGQGYGRVVVAKVPHYWGPVPPEPILCAEFQRACRLHSGLICVEFVLLLSFGCPKFREVFLSFVIFRDVLLFLQSTFVAVGLLVDLVTGHENLVQPFEKLGSASLWHFVEGTCWRSAMPNLVIGQRAQAPHGAFCIFVPQALKMVEIC